MFLLFYSLPFPWIIQLHVCDKLTSAWEVFIYLFSSLLKVSLLSYGFSDDPIEDVLYFCHCFLFLAFSFNAILKVSISLLILPICS